MQRIPFVAVEDMPAILSEKEFRSPISRLMAHAPTVMPAWKKLTDVMFARPLMNPLEREMAVLAVACLQRCEYVWSQHEVKAETLGASREQIEAIRRGDFASPLFSARQRALLGYVGQVVMDVRVDDPTFAAATVHFSYRELVEIMFTLGAAMTTVRIIEVAQMSPG